MVNGWTVPGFTQEQDLGGGVIGKVILAVDDVTQTKVAIKYLDPRLDGDEAYLSRFRAVARRLSQLEDPNVVDFFDLVEVPQGTAIVMERVDGVTLRRVLAAQGPTGPLAALSLFGGTLLGLAAAHELEVLHGSLRPCNVLIDAKGNARLTDFSLAPPGTEAQAGSAYAAPELWDGAPISARSDLYAATAMFFECLTGRPPYTGRGVAKSHREAPIPVEAVPGPLRDLIAAGLAKDPEQRPASAAEFLGAVEDAAVAAYGPSWEAQGRERITELAGQAAAAPEPRPARSSGRNAVVPARQGKRSKAKPLVAVVAVLAIGGGVAAAATVLGKDKADDPPHPTTSGSPQPVPTADPAQAGARALADRVDAALTRAPGAKFSFRRAGGAGPLSARGSFGLAGDGPAAYSMSVSGAGDTRKATRAVAIRDAVYLQAGKGWRRLPADAAARGYPGLAAQVRQASAVANVPALLRASTAFKKNGTLYQGTAAADRLGDAAPLFAGAGQVSYTFRLDKAARPVHLVIKVAGAKPQTLTTTYSTWGRKVITAPKA
ncbi:serine/threonine-protein kinase [Actinomadura macrotermitis]|uniref:non-specific serine/threonine protein kinase n=1 Tax=Actinomadura macrotermitis TaxID=2585200 RepID=A0A7K0BY53_9ACTN|nr:serine/threonine-protein kinase [Actinomadura macrotermitis]MQY06016.1 Serine/threonine-protein kinase PknD [Actinomadura macrotermitis]